MVHIAQSIYCTKTEVPLLWCAGSASYRRKAERDLRGNNREHVLIREVPLPAGLDRIEG